jgi:hypothetical protein
MLAQNGKSQHRDNALCRAVQSSHRSDLFRFRDCCVYWRRGLERCFGTASGIDARSKGFGAFLQKIIARASYLTLGRQLYRMDCAFDAVENYGILLCNNLDFVIKRNNAESEHVHQLLQTQSQFCFARQYPKPDGRGSTAVALRPKNSPNFWATTKLSQRELQKLTLRTKFTQKQVKTRRVSLLNASSRRNLQTNSPMFLESLQKGTAHTRKRPSSFCHSWIQAGDQLLAKQKTPPKGEV